MKLLLRIIFGSSILACILFISTSKIHAAGTNKTGDSCLKGAGLSWGKNGNDYCESGICIQDTCRAEKNDLTEYCGESADCKSNYCNNNKCSTTTDTRDPKAVLTKEDQDGCLFGFCNYNTYHCAYGDGGSDYYETYNQPRGTNYDTRVSCPTDTVCHSYSRPEGTGIQCVPITHPASIPDNCTTNLGLTYGCFPLDLGSGRACPTGWTDSNQKTCGGRAEVCCYKTTSEANPETENKLPQTPPQVPQKPSLPKNTVTCTAPDHKCATEANRPDGYSYVDSELNRKALDDACGGGLNYCWTRVGSSSTTPGAGSPSPSLACSSITVTNPDGAFNIDGYNKCKTTEDCFINAGVYYKPGFCDSIINRGVVCGQNATKDITYYCNKNQSCQTLSGLVYCTDNGTIQPGNGNNSCATADGKQNNTICSSKICNSTTLKCDPITPQTPPTSIKDPAVLCKDHGGNPTYINSACDHMLYNEAEAKTGKFCSTKEYFDRYTCADGITFDIPVPDQNGVCSSGAWCPAGSEKSGIATGCKDGRGQDLDCATRGTGWTCTFDYPTDLSRIERKSCTRPGRRWCDTAGADVLPSQGCGSPYSSQGTQCTFPANAPAGDTLGSCEPNQNLECKTIKNVKTCQYKQDASGNPVIFTPTPGAPLSNDCTTLIANGHGAVGCACPHGGGCGPLLGCYASDDNAPTTDNPNSQYCAPAGQRWCARKAVSASDNSCTSGTGITPSPTPPDLSWQYDCPADNVNACVVGLCESNGLQPNTKTGPGGTNGNRACSYAATNNPNATGSSCCIPKSPTTPVTTSPSPVSTSPNPATGGSVACPNTATEQCQQEGTAPNWGCFGSWTQTGKTCPAPSVCCKSP